MKNSTRDFIYLCSQSASRKQLLEIADISYKTLSHTSDEIESDTSPEFSLRVLAIAKDKMKSVVLPDYSEYMVDAKKGASAVAKAMADRRPAVSVEALSEDWKEASVSKGATRPIFVLTADTLIRATLSNQVLGKPRDINHARDMIGLLRREPAEVVTGCCLEKRIYENGAWQLQDTISWTTSSIAEFIIDEAMVEQYFEKVPFFLNIAAGCAVEGYGQSFLKSVNGSYTGILGLPLFELRQALKKLDFKF